jgi:hypothetical protein
MPFLHHHGLILSNFSMLYVPSTSFKFSTSGKSHTRRWYYLCTRFRAPYWKQCAETRRRMVTVWIQIQANETTYQGSTWFHFDIVSISFCSFRTLFKLTDLRMEMVAFIMKLCISYESRHMIHGTLPSDHMLPKSQVAQQLIVIARPANISLESTKNKTT